MPAFHNVTMSPLLLQHAVSVILVVSVLYYRQAVQDVFHVYQLHLPIQLMRALFRLFLLPNALELLRRLTRPRRLSRHHHPLLQVPVLQPAPLAPQQLPPVILPALRSPAVEVLALLP